MPPSRARTTRLEPEYAEAYSTYRRDPTPAATGALLRAVHPVLKLGVRTYGGGDSPVLLGAARRIALDAFPRYDPAKSALKTHLMAHLRGLHRESAALAEPLGVPEQVALDRRRLHSATEELRERLNRDPSDAELADHVGLSRRRIEHVRRYRPSATSGEVGAMFGAGDDEEGPYEPAVEGPDRSKLVAGFLYDDCDGPDQLILEHGLGLNGARILPHREIARRANLTPAAISLRARRLQSRLDALSDEGIF